MKKVFFFVCCFFFCCAAWAWPPVYKENVAHGNFWGLYEGECRDFLADLGLKQDYMEFERCISSPESQGAPMEAVYRVAGRDAAQAEQFMQERFAIPALKFVCCYWEMGTYRVRYIDKRTGVDYYMSISSEETLHNQREEWGEIGYFYISVEVFRKEI